MYTNSELALGDVWCEKTTTPVNITMSNKKPTATT